MKYTNFKEIQTLTFSNIPSEQPSSQMDHVNKKIFSCLAALQDSKIEVTKVEFSILNSQHGGKIIDIITELLQKKILDRTVLFGLLHCDFTTKEWSVFDKYFWLLLEANKLIKENYLFLWKNIRHSHYAIAMNALLQNSIPVTILDIYLTNPAKYHPVFYFLNRYKSSLPFSERMMINLFTDNLLKYLLGVSTPEKSLVEVLVFFDRNDAAYKIFTCQFFKKNYQTFQIFLKLICELTEFAYLPADALYLVNICISALEDAEILLQVQKDLKCSNIEILSMILPRANEFKSLNIDSFNKLCKALQDPVILKKIFELRQNKIFNAESCWGLFKTIFISKEYFLSKYRIQFVKAETIQYETKSIMTF